MSIRIITDSTSDITQVDAKNLNISVVPLRVRIDNEEFQDGINLTAEEFYEKLKEAKSLPVTSQPSPEDFLKLFEDAKANNDEVIVITISSLLSGTNQSATLAKSLCEYDKIYIVDSCNVTLGLNLLVKYAVSLRDKLCSAEEIALELNKVKERINILAVVDTLEYLKKGGRLSSTAALAGTLLSIKPIIRVKDGVVAVAAKARGTNGAFSKIKSLIEETGGIDFNMPHLLGYTGAVSVLEPFEAYLDKSMELTNLPVNIIGSTVGVHAGPGACGIAYFAK